MVLVYWASGRDPSPPIPHQPPGYRSEVQEMMLHCLGLPEEGASINPGLPTPPPPGHPVHPTPICTVVGVPLSGGSTCTKVCIAVHWDHKSPASPGLGLGGKARWLASIAEAWRRHMRDHVTMSLGVRRATCQGTGGMDTPCMISWTQSQAGA